MPARALIQIDSAISNLREKIAQGTDSQIARIELMHLEEERQRIIEAMVKAAEAGKKEA